MELFEYKWGDGHEVLSSELKIKNNEVQVKIELDSGELCFSGKYDEEGKFEIAEFSENGKDYLTMYEDDEERLIIVLDMMGIPAICFEDKSISELNEYFGKDIDVCIDYVDAKWEKIK